MLYMLGVRVGMLSGKPPSDSDESQRVIKDDLKLGPEHLDNPTPVRWRCAGGQVSLADFYLNLSIFSCNIK